MLRRVTTNLSKTRTGSLLGDQLDSWDRNNTILVNLRRVLPDGGMDARALSQRVWMEKTKPS